MQYSPQKTYEMWLAYPQLDDSMRTAVESLQDSSAIEECFGRELFVGMGGLTAKLGCGTSFLNIHTFSRIARGAAQYAKEVSKDALVLIGRDGRATSNGFARLLAQIFADEGITVSVIEDMIPSPVFSRAIRRSSAGLGFYITAAHHSALSNGMIVYDGAGCLLLPDEMKKLDNAVSAFDALDTDVSDRYDILKAGGSIVADKTPYFEEYTEALHVLGFPEVKNGGLKVLCVPQTKDEGDRVKELFTSFGLTNLEFSEVAFGESFPMPYHRDMALSRYAYDAFRFSDADILVCTDSSLNNCSIAVKKDGSVFPFTGNELGALLLDEKCRYRTEHGTMPKHPLIAASIVVSPMLNRVAEARGIQVVDTLIGFRSIVRVMEELDQAGRMYDFLIGFEDNGSALTNDLTRDKDALSTALAVVTTACKLADENSSLCDALRSLNEKYGYFAYSRDRFSFEGPTGSTRMYNLLRLMCHDIPTDIGGMKVLKLSDYERRSTIDVNTLQTSTIPLASAEITALTLEEGTVILRPSASKPLLRVYISAFDKSEEKAAKNLAKIRAAMKTWIAQRT